MIYRFQPFSTDKKLGEVYNAHCSLVPHDDDWIQLTDYDAMILTPDTYRVIERAVARYPDTDIFGAITNRVGYTSQRLLPMMDTNYNMEYQIATAKGLASRYGAGEVKVAKAVAGFFLLFKKSYWKKNPFQPFIFDKRGYTFDQVFCRRANKMNIILGAYLWHSYRLDKDFHDKEHLK